MIKAVFLVLGFVTSSLTIAAPHKCEINGKISYQENNCEAGKIEEKTEAVKDYTEKNRTLERKILEKLKIMGFREKFDIDSSAKGQEIKIVKIKIKNMMLTFDKHGELIKYEKT